MVSCENASASECGLKKTALDTLGLGEPGIAHVDCDAETTLPATPATPSSYTGSSKTCVLDGGALRVAELLLHCTADSMADIAKAPATLVTSKSLPFWRPGVGAVDKTSGCCFFCFRKGWM